MAKFMDKIRSLLSGKKPLQAPRLQGPGHRGVALGSGPKREEANRAFLAGETTQQPWSKEEVEKWENLPASAVENFVYGGAVLYVNSSNVAAFQYDAPGRMLIVQYKNGQFYAYDEVSEPEAFRLAQDQSKGSAVWDLLRVRGSATEHRKPYRKVAGWFTAGVQPFPRA